MEDKDLSFEMVIKEKDDIQIIEALLKKAWNNIENKKEMMRKNYSFLKESMKTPEKTKKPKTERKTTIPEKGIKIKTHNGAGIFANILNDIKGKNTKEQKEILRQYYPDLKRSTLNSYLNSYNSYNKYNNKISLSDIAKVRKEKKWRVLRGPVVDYYKTVPIYRDVYVEIKKLKRSGRLKLKIIKSTISKFMPDASPNTIKAYANGYKKYALSPKEPNDRKYDEISAHDKKKVLDALHKVYNQDEKCDLDNILKEVDFTSTKTKLCLHELVKEQKVKKENNHYFLKFTTE